MAPVGTKLRNVRVPAEVWEPARDSATELGASMTDLVIVACQLVKDSEQFRAALQVYVKGGKK